MIELTSESLGPNSIYWLKNKKYLKYSFSLRVYQYAAGKMFDKTVHLNTNILPKNIKERFEITDKIRGINRSSSKEKQFQRLLIGNNGLFQHLSPSKCNLSSKAANKLKRSGAISSNFVDDHIVGVTSIGEFVINEFKNNYLKIGSEQDWLDIDYIHIQKSLDKMSDEWLLNHLWLWATCRLTKEEHKCSKDNDKSLKRGTNMSIIDKVKLEHYNDANIIIEGYN